MTLSVSITFPQATPPPDPDPDDDDVGLYTVKADQFSWSWSKQVRDVAPAPAVNRTGEIGNPSYFNRSIFYERWQWFTIDLLSLSVHGVVFGALADEARDTMIQKWGMMYSSWKFLNNRDGVDNRNNYITGDERGEDPKIDPLICASSIVRVLEVRTSTSGITNGMKMARLDAFDVNETPPLATLQTLDDPRILSATVINKDGSIDHFPQYPGIRHPYPMISSSNSERWFPLVDLVKL